MMQSKQCSKNAPWTLNALSNHVFGRAYGCSLHQYIALILDTYGTQCKMDYCLNKFLKKEHGKFFRQECNLNKGAASIDRIPAPLREVIQNNRLQHGKRS
jgi:hypothetical protein